MNKPLDSLSAPTRRSLLVGATVVGGALLVGCSIPDALSAGSKFKPGAFGPFLKLAADGTVTVVSKHIEFGQGNHAGLAAIVAEESQGMRSLYVALTRATKRLAVVHDEPLPDVLVTPAHQLA